MASKSRKELADRLRERGFSVKPLPLGGYVITDLAGAPMLATPYPSTPVHQLAPGNFVDIRPGPDHQYICEV